MGKPGARPLSKRQKRRAEAARNRASAKISAAREQEQVEYQRARNVRPFNLVSSENCSGFDYDQLGRSRHRINELRDKREGKDRY